MAKKKALEPTLKALPEKPTKAIIHCPRCSWTAWCKPDPASEMIIRVGLAHHLQIEHKVRQKDAWTESGKPEFELT